MNIERCNWMYFAVIKPPGEREGERILMWREKVRFEFLGSRKRKGKESIILQFYRSLNIASVLVSRVTLSFKFYKKIHLTI